MKIIDTVLEVKELITFSDVHLSNYLSYSDKIKGVNCRLQRKVDEIKRICSLAEDKPRLVVCCGDWFDARLNDPLTLAKSADIINYLNEREITTIILTGNHDFDGFHSTLLQYEKNKLNKFVYTINQPTIFKMKNGTLFFAPGTGDIKSIHNDIINLNNIVIVQDLHAEGFASAPYILFFHAAVKDATYGKKICEFGLKWENFNDRENGPYNIFDYFIAGDFHRYQSIPNGYYCGSLGQENRGDLGKKRGYQVFNLKTLKHEFYSSKLPRFMEIIYDEYNGADVSDRIVNVLFDRKTMPIFSERSSFLKRLIKEGAFYVSPKLVGKKKDKIQREHISSDLSQIEMLEKYVKLKKGSNENKYIDIGREILRNNRL